jgi:ubiquinone/menaquinone biosynthesis C-methylase UbiE
MHQEQAPQKARLSQPAVAILYDKLAGPYDIWGHLTESNARNRALALANIRPGEHVLEVAVGTGLAFIHLLRNNPDRRNVGIDISRGMLSKAENNR